MRKTLRIVAALLALCFVLGIAPVNLLENTAPLMETAEAATKPTLSATSKSLLIGKSFTLSVKNAGGKKVTWSTSNKAIATVTTKGVVKAVKPGTATITARVGSTKLTCKVTVKTPKSSMTTAKLAKGQSFTLKVSYAGTAKVTWTTSSKAIATVTSKGVVKGVKTGTATITAKVAGKSLKCKVTVIASGSITGTTGKTMQIGKKQTLSVVGFPGKTVTWKSSNTAVATVTTKGVVTAKKAGTVTITATVASKKLTYKITVKSNATPKPDVYTSEIEVLYVDIPFDTICEYDPAYEAGAVMQEGVNGRMLQNWRVNKKNGVEIERYLDSEFPELEPVAQILNYTSLDKFTFSDVVTLDIFVGCKITGYTGSDTVVAIPSQNAKGKAVTEIGENVFKDNTALQHVIIPNGVIVIQNNAFEGCTGLTGDLVFPDSMIQIWDGVFTGCTGLTGTLTFGNQLSEIGHWTFEECNFTGPLVIPDSVKQIYVAPFKNCTGFTSLTLGKNIEFFSEYAFYGCTGLTGGLVIPGTVYEIMQSVFENCENLDGTLTFETIPDGPGLRIFYDAFKGCSKLTGSLTIPDRVTEIGNSAFEGCSGLNGTLTLGSGVTAISEGVFKGCSGLTGLNLNSNLTSIGASAFEGCSSIAGTLTLPSGVTEIGAEAFKGCSDISIYLPDNITSIGDQAFESVEHVYYNEGTITAETFSHGFPFGANAVN